MQDKNQTFDFIIVGSGAAAMSAALQMKAAGKAPLILEKQAVVGGSTAFSGGVLWVPDNPYLAELGAGDSYERARTYMDELIGDVGPASSPERRTAFLQNGPAMIRFLQKHGMDFLHADWPDYYSDNPGGLAQGRSLVSPLFNINELNEWSARLAHFSMFSSIPINANEARALSLVKRSWTGRRMALRLAWRMLKKKVTGQELRGSGNAIQGRLLQILLRLKVPIWTESPVQSLIVEEGQVAGVVVEQGGRTIEVRARLGVLVNCGGFSHNLAMRKKYQPEPVSVDWTVANPGDTGELLQDIIDLGADFDFMNEAWWTPSSFQSDGNIAGFHIPNDAGKPFSIIVDSKGKRFANEAGPYMEFGQRMYASGAVPAWSILDSRHRRYYPWGTIPPGRTARSLIESGYFKKAGTIEELAAQCGIDVDGLKATIVRFNRFARLGKDEDFRRGDTAYNRYSGDPRIGPNPCLGSIEKPPYYATAIYPADVGTAGGVLTDEHSRVVHKDGSVIRGLYAAGNCTASVMGRCYPGAGASIAASMVFGYIAAQHACGVSE